MTDCENAEIRDLLPDLAAEALGSAERLRVQRHVDGCAECSAELALLRSVRALRPRAVSIDVAKIVAQLPRPMTANAADPDPTIISLSARREAARVPAVAAGRRSRSVWRMAAAIGVIIAGGWSVVMVRSGGIGVMTADSVQLTDTAAPARGLSESMLAVVDSQQASAASPATTGAAVSFGDVGNYTDEELQRVLDRLERWDGATSTESVTSAPILPVPNGGSLE